MRQAFFGAVLLLAPLVASAQQPVASPEMQGLQLRYQIGQLHSQLGQAQQAQVAAEAQLMQKNAWWAAYVRGLKCAPPSPSRH